MTTLAAPGSVSAPAAEESVALRRSPSIDKAVEHGTLVKLAGQAVGLLFALPHLVAYWVGCRTIGPEKAFRGSSERIAATAGTIGVYARQWFYGCTLAEVGDDVYFGYMSMFSKQDARVGDRAYIGRFCSVGLADLGEEAVLADGVQVLSGRHQHGTGDGRYEHGDLRFEKVTVGARAWLGANAVVMANVGDGATVGAGAVVTKPVAAGDKVVGVPAKPMDVGAITLPNAA